jgi:hypothetical protein
MRVEIMIERDACHPALPCKLQDVGIVGSVQTRVADVERLPPFRP